MPEVPEAGILSPMTLDLSSLNPPQLDAVMATEGPLLVIAGAGTGKTKTLTYRIAHIIDQGLAKPWEILAITFTNKAAGEMRERLIRLAGDAGNEVWCSTFHSMCVKFLRRDADRLGYKKNFTIYDDGDSKRLMRRVLKDLGIDEKEVNPKAALSIISKAKNSLTDIETALGSGGSSDSGGDFGEGIIRVAEAYQSSLKASNAMDFDDLLVAAWTLLSQHADVREHYQRKFRYLSTDEFQDTNIAQLELVKLLSGRYRNVMVVGDDAQSIYGWRQADIRNILEFERHWPEAVTIKLEQNYRSTGHIVEATNSLIGHNETGRKKKLFTIASKGDRIAGILVENDRDEAWAVAREIGRLRGEGYGLGDFAVFYRTHAQSRPIEDAFLKSGTPYKIVGGTRYFDRAEVRDVTAYLKALVNPADAVSLRRIVNVPKRGVGDASMEKLESWGRGQGLVLWDALREAAWGRSPLPARAANAVGSFVATMESLQSLDGDV
ncbi:MAG: UvrD-helicase domain-containing protein, partial [Desulfobacterales bacterium]|nr:UvrD-helicase domain-containing protein [Desulfobacterales bacterium]